MEKQAIKYCLYARKSTESDERQAMSIDSQIKEMTDMAQREGLNVIEIKQESHSAKQSGQRPIFLELIEDLRNDKYQGILTWAPDRLSRNAGDLGSLVDLMDSNHLVHIRTFGQSFSNTPNEKFLLMILCSQAKLENDNRGVNVKRGIRAKCEMGWRPCMPPIGYYNRAFNGVKDIVVDPERAPYIKEMYERVALKQHSGRTIKRWLDENGFTTRAGKKATISQIYLMLKNPFYYGTFEYPKKSGTWYEGSHPKLVSEELFGLVQKQLAVPQKSKWGAKEFPFRRFLVCASCGSQIVGEEKFKQRADGGRNRHVYYHCSRQIDYSCPEPYVKEERLIETLLGKVDMLMLDNRDAEQGLINAISKFTAMMKTTNKSFDSTESFHIYARYVLESGSAFEKTRLIRNVSCKLAIHNRTIIELEDSAA
ncbi:MAG: recombinase family protein [Patescibacteria group bacterium]|nr:recombinase family protein [Patescibacteria group bacterium]